MLNRCVPRSGTCGGSKRPVNPRRCSFTPPSVKHGWTALPFIQGSCSVSFIYPEHRGRIAEIHENHITMIEVLLYGDAPRTRKAVEVNHVVSHAPLTGLPGFLKIPTGVRTVGACHATILLELQPDDLLPIVTHPDLACQIRHLYTALAFRRRVDVMHDIKPL